MFACGIGGGDFAIPDILCHPLGGALQRIAKATAAGLHMRHQVVFAQRHGDLARQLALHLVMLEQVLAAGGRLAASQGVGRKLDAIGTQLQQRLRVEQAIAAPYAQAAAPQSGAATVADQFIGLDAYRMLGFQRLDRRVGQILRGIGDGLDAILVGACTPGTADHVDDDERAAATIVAGMGIRLAPGDADHGVAAFTGCGNAPWHDLRQCSQHGVEHPVAGERPCCHRRRLLRVEHAALGHKHLDGTEHAGIVGYVPGQRTAHRQEGARLGVGQRGVDRRPHLRRRAAVVDADMVVVHGDGNLDGNRLGRQSIVIDVIGEAVGALGPAPDFLARHALGIVEDFLQIEAGGGAAVALEQLAQFAHTHPRAGILRPQIAQHPLGQSHVQPDQSLQGVVHLAALVQLDHRDAQAFLIDLG